MEKQPELRGQRKAGWLQQIDDNNDERFEVQVDRLKQSVILGLIYMFF